MSLSTPSEDFSPEQEEDGTREESGETPDSSAEILTPFPSLVMSLPEFIYKRNILKIQ